MGREVNIVRVSRPKPEQPEYIRFEIDRRLTGSGHESYDEPPSADSTRPSDVLARELFATKLVKCVHVFSNIVTIRTMGESVQEDTLRDAVEQLFVHYRPGVKPTPV
jgi:hypothetical protein